MESRGFETIATPVPDANYFPKFEPYDLDLFTIDYKYVISRSFLFTNPNIRDFAFS